jgi:hypothetical protein
MRATLAPMVTAIATSLRTFHSGGEGRETPRPLRVTPLARQVAESNHILTVRYITRLSGAALRRGRAEWPAQTRDIIPSQTWFRSLVSTKCTMAVDSAQEGNRGKALALIL